MLSQSAASVVATMFPGLICFCNPTIFIEKDLYFARFPKHLGIWDLCPSVNPNHTRMPEEVCAERLTWKTAFEPFGVGWGFSTSD